MAKFSPGGSGPWAFVTGQLRRAHPGIERWAPALGRCEGDLGAGILEDIVRRRQFLQPEAGLAPRVAELVVGGKNLAGARLWRI
jgi:hypothetical protein